MMNTGLAALRLCGLRVAALVAALVLVAWVPSAARAGTLDQQQTDSSGGRSGIVGPGIFGTTSRAQTFTAGLSGGLDQVDLFLDNGGVAQGPLTVEIRNTSGGSPGATVLATASVSAATVPPRPGAFVAVVFGSPAPVTAGTQYAIVAYTGGSDVYFWYRGSGDTYPLGAPFRSGSSPPSTWDSEGPADRAFRTYVVVPPPPLPQTKDDCKNGGWQQYGFKNQGDCVSWVTTGGNNPPAGP